MKYILYLIKFSSEFTGHKDRNGNDLTQFSSVINWKYTRFLQIFFLLSHSPSLSYSQTIKNSPFQLTCCVKCHKNYKFVPKSILFLQSSPCWCKIISQTESMWKNGRVLPKVIFQIGHTHKHQRFLTFMLFKKAGPNKYSRFEY